MTRTEASRLKGSGAGQPSASRRPESVHSPRRLFWISLLLLHLGPLRSFVAGVVSDSETLIIIGSGLRLLGWAAWTAFFILKILDVSWLRLNPGWRSRLSAVLVVGLLHIGVAERLMSRETELSPAQLGFMLTAAVTWRGDELRRRIEHWWALGGAARDLKTDDARGLHVPAPFARVRTPALHFVPAFARLRAPPVLL